MIRMRVASQWSRPCLARAAARPKLPRNRKIRGWAKLEKLELTSKMPVRAASMGTRIAVSANGKASVSQSKAATLRIARPVLIIAGSSAVTESPTGR